MTSNRHPKAKIFWQTLNFPGIGDREAEISGQVLLEEHSWPFDRVQPSDFEYQLS